MRILPNFTAEYVKHFLQDGLFSDAENVLEIAVEKIHSRT